MTQAAMLMELAKIGVVLSRDGDKLVLDGPEARLTDALVEKLRAVKLDILRALGNWDSADWQTFFEERAGIAEFDNGLPRGEAEDCAFACCIVEWVKRNGISPTDASSAHFSDRKTEAAAALAAMGIAPPAEFPDDFGKNGGA